MEENSIVRRLAKLLQEEVDDELVALDVQGGAYYGFNSSARRIWALIEQPKTVGEIRDALVAEFDIDPATCETEVMELLTQLEADKLVRLEPALQSDQASSLRGPGPGLSSRA